MIQHDFDEITDRRGTDSEKWNNYPPDVLPMWVADSDFKCPAPVIEALLERVRHGVFGYCKDDLGKIEKASAHWMRTRFGWDVRPEWVVFSPGVGTALSVAVSAFTNPGDYVVMMTPIYPPFFTAPAFNGRKALSSPLQAGKNGWEIDFDGLESLLAEARSKLLLLCNPHNPTGKLLSEGELLRTGELCLKHHVLVLSDEVHCDYVFGDRKHIPFSSLSPELADISLTAINPSKTFNLADLRTGGVISSSTPLRERYRTAVTNAKLGRSSLGLLAYEVAYTQCAYYVDQLVPYIKGNLDCAVDYINERIPGISVGMPEATYLLWLDCRGLGLSQKRLVEFFLREAKVALNSGLSFGPEGLGFMRLNAACPRAVLREGLARIERACRAFADKRGAPPPALKA
ncbi:MAG: pyridoxal phosphate-dependent aminotransferase [Desulfovibrio sp.]|jgi:cystathionine beta-lyase|nr:pyridoxal phosphate-dependent aminotransferase [Desulfovibrio sp.]